MPHVTYSLQRTSWSGSRNLRATQRSPGANCRWRVAAPQHSSAGGVKRRPTVSFHRFRDREREASDHDDKLALDELEIFRKDVGTFVRQYDFLSQIVNYDDTSLD